MGKNTLFTGQPIFNQILSLIPDHLIRRINSKYDLDRYAKSFYFHDHLITMLFGVFHKCTSLREVTTGMQANGNRLRHLGLTNTPRRSTLAEGNIRRTEAAFEELFHLLINYYADILPDSKAKREMKRLYIIDSSTITLFNGIMRGTGLGSFSGKRKGGAKVHMVLDSDNNLPSMVRITEGRMPDRGFLNEVFLPEGAKVVMDKGYNSYKKYREWNEKGVKWYTRLNKAAVHTINNELTVSEEEMEAGVLSDSLILLGNPHTTTPQQVRLVCFFDKEKGGNFKFITNDLDCSALDVAMVYKKRWQIETYFKCLKQNSQMLYFLGDSENAIKIQIWCTLIANLLLNIIMQISKRKWSFGNIGGLIRLHLNTYINLFEFLKNPEKALLKYKPPNEEHQWALF